ncbi:MAG: hypothetical protein GF350_00215 [Chitinivibrionales bacterium]|nr:hypothetical protein [Chitinivibrionales bacterium]
MSENGYNPGIHGIIPEKRSIMKNAFSASIVFLCLLFVAHAGAGKKLIVPQDAPSIQKGIDMADDGDTVYVLNGIYKENIVLKEYVTLAGQDKQKTIIRARKSRPVVKGVNYSVIRNVTIEKGQTGILCENTNTVIEHTIIRTNHTGIHCLISLPEIRNNVIYRNKWTGIYCELVAHGTNTAIEHNVIAENGYSGLVLARKSAVLVQNNILFNNKLYGIYVDMDSKRSRIIYNNFFGNRQQHSHYAVVDKTNTYRDPQFRPAGADTYDFVASVATPMQGIGKDGADVGLMSDAERKQIYIDSDGDKIADDEDKCPDLKEDIDEYEDWDGCPDYDNDLDGIYDTEDQCSHKAEDYDGFRDRDGCPDPDNDKDGICDPWVEEQGAGRRFAEICTGSDKCPMKPENINGYMDDDGCPDETPVEEQAEEPDEQ